MTVRAMVLERRGLALVTSRVACLFGFPPLGHPPYTNATPIYTTAASHPSRSSADKLTWNYGGQGAPAVVGLL